MACCLKYQEILHLIYQIVNRTREKKQGDETEIKTKIKEIQKVKQTFHITIISTPYCDRQKILQYSRKI